jgi:hypothetical protein
MCPAHIKTFQHVTYYYKILTKDDFFKVIVDLENAREDAYAIL